MTSIMGSDNPGPGALPTFQADVAQSTRVREFQGSAGQEAANVFGNLSHQLGQWEDRAAEDVGKQQGEIAGLDPVYRPDTDESVMGIARRNAANQIYGNTLEAQARNSLGDVYEQYSQLPADQRNPAKLQQMIGGVKQDFDQNHVFDQVAAPFNLAFNSAAAGYLRQAQSDQDQRTLDAAKVSFTTNMKSSADSLMRLASLPASTPQELAAAANQGKAAIDNAVNQNLLTPEQAQKMKDDLTVGSASTHLWAHFISLPPGPARMSFLEQFNNSVGGGADYYGNLKKAESGGNPNASSGVANGLYQFTAATWRGTMQAHPELGLTADGVFDPAQQEKAVRALTADNETMLRGAGVPITNQNRYMAHFLGAGGAISFMHAMSADPSASFASVFPKEAAANPGIANGRSLQQVYDLMGQKINGGGKSYGDTLALPYDAIGRLQGAMEGQLRSDQALAEHAQKAALSDIGDKTKLLEQGVAIHEDDWSALNQHYGTSPDPAVAQAWKLADISRNVITGLVGKSPAEVEQAAALMHAQLGNNPTPAMQQIANTLDGYAKKYREDVTKDPLGRAVSQGLAPSPAPFDFSSPQALAQTIRARAPVVATASSKLGVPVPFFSRDEGADFGQKIARADLPLAASADPASLAAMSEDEGFRKALIANARSGDPQRMHGAFGAMKAIADAAPMEFDSRFGKEASAQLDLWQSLQNYPAPEAAKMMLNLSDPAQAQQRKVRDEAADVAMKTMTPGAILKMFSQRQILNPMTWTSGAPEPPVSTNDSPGGAPDGLLADYRGAYKARFALDGSTDAASEYALDSIKKKWGVSDVNGGRLMPYPPERSYPSVNGGYEWMKQQLDADVKKAAGDMGVALPDTAPTIAELSARVAAGEAGAIKALPRTTASSAQIAAANRYGAPRALIADPQTAADIAGGRAPSYRVVIQDRDGHFHALEQSPGVPFRFFADPSGPQEAERNRFTRDLDQYRHPAASAPLNPSSMSIP